MGRAELLEMLRAARGKRAAGISTAVEAVVPLGPGRWLARYTETIEGGSAAGAQRVLASSALFEVAQDAPTAFAGSMCTRPSGSGGAR